MKGMYAILYYLANDAYGCFEWYKDKETAQRSFAKKKSNGNYKRAQLFDENGKKLDEFVRNKTTQGRKPLMRTGRRLQSPIAKGD